MSEKALKNIQNDERVYKGEMGQTMNERIETAIKTMPDLRKGLTSDDLLGWWANNQDLVQIALFELISSRTAQKEGQDNV